MLLTVLSLVAPKAFALTASDLVESCQVLRKDSLSGLDNQRSLWCVGYMQGALDGMLLYQDVLNNDKRPAVKSVCLPEEATNKEIGLVFLKFMDEHPEKLHESAGFTFWSAVSHAYPCHK
jgi:hypothetical protein